MVGKIATLHKWVGILYLHIAILRVVNGFIRLVGDRAETFGFSDNIAVLVDDGGLVFDIGVEMGHHVDCGEIVVVVSEGGEDFLTDLLDRIVVAEEID